MPRFVLVAAPTLATCLACRAAAPATGDETDGSETDTTQESGDETGDEGGWTISLQAGPERGAIMSVWGPAPERVFAVGGQPATPDDPSRGLALSWDGTEWTDEALPPDTAMLNWVYGIDDDVWAVGQGGAIVRRVGETWTPEAGPTDRTLWGVWGASTDELWAVGGNGSSDAPVLLVRREDAWQSVAVPSLDADAKGLFKVWGRDAADVWVVGDRGVTLHFDGNEWSAHEIDEGIDLISLWGSDAAGIVAVGGRANAYVARRIGDAWETETLLLPGLNGVWVDPAGSITAVGGQGTILTLESGGFGHTQEASPTPLALHATFGFSGGPRFAVGGTLLTAPPWTGVILIDE